jgi:hypothetical protein
MDVLSQKRGFFSLNFWIGVLVAATLGISQEWLGHAYYDELSAQWMRPFHQPWLRFAIREWVVYVNLFTGYKLLKRMHPGTPIPQLLAIFTIALDALFILSGISRLLFPNLSQLVIRYGDLYYYLTTGILFVFFHAMGCAWSGMAATIPRNKNGHSPNS